MIGFRLLSGFRPLEIRMVVNLEAVACWPNFASLKSKMWTGVECKVADYSMAHETTGP